MNCATSLSLGCAFGALMTPLGPLCFHFHLLGNMFVKLLLVECMIVLFQVVKSALEINLITARDCLALNFDDHEPSLAS